MGRGPLGFDRPGTAGDSGWLGAPRPLVGAANGIKATVTTPSAAQVAVANSQPESLVNLREELNEVNRVLDNKRNKLERMNELELEDLILEFEGRPTYSAFERRRENLFDDINMLEQERDNLINRLDEKRMALDEGDLPPHEIKDGIEDPVENALLGMGVSKGPFVDVGPTQTEILFTKTGIREEDISQVRNRLEELGFRVSNVEAIEV